MSTLVSPAAGAVAAALFFALFRLPFALGLAAAAVAIMIMAGVESYVSELMTPAVFVLGLLLLAAAMAFDVRDTSRRGVASDIAFWIHLVAAPFLVHGAVQWLIDFASDTLTLTQAFSVIAVLAVLSLIALVIDRRAMLVSGLVYLGYALYALLDEATRGGAEVALVVLILGIIVFALAAGWQHARRFVLGRFPRQGLLMYLPPIESSTS